MKRTETTGQRCYAASGPRSSAASAARAPGTASRMLPAARALRRMGNGTGTFCCDDVVPAHVISLRLVLEILSALGCHGSHPRVENWSPTRTVQGEATRIRPRWICGRQSTYEDQKQDSVLCLLVGRYLHSFPPPTNRPHQPTSRTSFLVARTRWRDFPS